MSTVHVNWDLCDGNGMCAVEAPDVFEMTDDDDLIILKNDVTADDEPSVRAASRVCPKRAISLKE